MWFDFCCFLALISDCMRSWDVESGVDMERMPVGFLGRTVLGHREIIVEIDDGSPPSSL